MDEAAVAVDGTSCSTTFVETEATKFDSSCIGGYQWDINRRMGAYMDPQMLLLILKWLKTKKAYSEESLNDSIKQIILSTTMLIDVFTAETGEAPPAGFLKRVEEAQVEFVQIESQVTSLCECMIDFGKERESRNLRGPPDALDRKSIQEWYTSWKAKSAEVAVELEKTLESTENPVEKAELSTRIYNYKTIVKFPENSLELFLRLSQLHYLFGEYETTKVRLMFYLDFLYEFTNDARERTDLTLACLWGLMAAMCASLPEAKSPEALQRERQPENSLAAAEAQDGSSSVAAAMGGELQNADNTKLVADDAYRICQIILMADDLIEGLSLKKQNRQKTLVERTWLFHRAIWPLMVYYFPRALAAAASETMSSNSYNVIPYNVEWMRLIEWLFSDKNINLICMVAPHLLRYIAVIAILNKQRQDHFKIAVDAIARCSERYSDPFTSILDSLFVEYDFEKSQERLALCSEAASADFFLSPLQLALEENSRLLIFQTYCRIQKSINIDVMARKLHMTPETAECWIVNLIRGARLEAKIDGERNRVEIATQAQNVYQQIIDKTKNLIIRSNVLVQQLERPTGVSSGGQVSVRHIGDFGSLRTRGRGGIGGEYGGLKRIR